MEQPRKKKTDAKQVEQMGIGECFGFALLNEDLLQNILGRLPALSFASAACVSRTWYRVSNRVLSRPRLASALSLNPSLQEAAKEALDKVLSEPIRPHFVIASIGDNFSGETPDSSLELTQHLITKRLGSRTPIVVSVTRGIIGRDAGSNEVREVKWDQSVGDSNGEVDNLLDNVNRNHGIVLIVGYLPGLKVGLVQLLRKKPYGSMVDKFVMDVRNYSASISGSTSPSAILIFGDHNYDMKPVLDKLGEYILEGGRFLYTSGDNSSGRVNSLCDAVALILANDRENSRAVGKTQFHVTMSAGMSPVGPTHKAVSVKERGESYTWLTAKREGHHEILDGQRILSDINDEMENRLEYFDLYIGVTKRRKCAVGSEKMKWMTSMAFYEILGGDEEYLFVNRTGIKTGDSFRFYHSDSNTALSSCNIVSEYFRKLRPDLNHENGGIAHNNEEEVFGGILFTCCGRGESFFGRPNVDSFPFSENFPRVPLAGIFCAGEVGRYPSNLIRQGQEQNSPHCYSHFYTTVYLVMSYTPAPLGPQR